MDTSRVDGVKAPRDAEIALLGVRRAHHETEFERLLEEARLHEVVRVRDHVRIKHFHLRFYFQVLVFLRHISS